MIRTGILAMVAGAAVAAWAENPAQDRIEPGLWEITSAVTNVDMVGAASDPGKLTAPTVTHRCLSAEDAAKGPQGLLLETRPDCRFTHSSMHRGRLHATLTCTPATGKAMTVEVKGRFGAKAYDAVSTIAMKGNRTTMRIAATGRWIGACSS